MSKIFIIMIGRASLFLGLMVSTLSFGQKKKNDFSVWYVYNGNYNISKRWALNYGAQYRSFDGLKDSRLALVRAAGEYKFKDIPITVGAGYMFLHFTPYNDSEDLKIQYSENRLFQYFIIEQKIGSFEIENRFRIEERWLEDRGFRYRYRYRFRVSLPISINHQKTKWSATMYNEIRLFNLENIFEANRLYAGGIYKVNKNFGLGAGWVIQTRQNGRSEHYLSLSINHSL